MNIDDSDKVLAEAFEAALKDASIHGSVNGTIPFTAPVMTADQYAPASGVPSTLPRDFNRDTGIAVAAAIRSVPMRVPVYVVHNLPPPVAGGIVFVSDGGPLDGPVLAFSDGIHWFACNTLLAIV